MSNQQLAYPHTVSDIINEYEEKAANLEQCISDFQAAIDGLNNATSVGLGRRESLVPGCSTPLHEAERILKASTWWAIYNTLNFDSVFSITDKKAFEQSLSNPAEPTPENIAGTFGKYWQNPRHYILQGLAEVFCGLDRFYKSHSNFGFGVKGLPKRVILTSFRGWSSWGFESLTNMCKAMEQVAPDMWLGEYVPPEERKPWRDIIRENCRIFEKSTPFKLEKFGLEIRTFLNGNAHVYFNKKALELINDCLHEFYGHVVPDDVPAPTSKQETTEVSKDLAFYPTPKAAIEFVLNKIHIPSEGEILEPSCGEGAILDAISRRTTAKLYGVEYHKGRAEICRKKGYRVWNGNFLEYVTSGYDMVIMNPPFAGKHWVKHVKKANDVLKVGGQGVAILPASAERNENLPTGGMWYDLPMGSFRESGTNVNTGFYIWSKRQ